MKTLISLLFGGWLLAAALPGSAQGNDQLPPVRAALASGSSRGLTPYLAASVEVGFDGDKQAYNTAQAELVLRNFFAKNPPASFDIVHQGASNEGIPYAIGQYVARGGGSYRVFIKLKPKTSSPVIDTLDFTRE